MTPSHKCDPDLGLQVNKHLAKMGLGTPVVIAYNDNPADQIDNLKGNFVEIHKTLGLDLNDDSIADTPSRLAKMWVLEKFWGLRTDLFPKCTAVENKIDYNLMVCEKNIKVMSVCEHHWETIHGTATVAYIPHTSVLGLSKLNRIVDYFSRRPQIQERLTKQIGETLKLILSSEDVAVSINAKHYCVISRGIEDQNSTTTTSFLSGKFKTGNVRQEFYEIANGRG